MLAKISQKLPELSSAERRVAECVLAQSKWFVHAAVANIAREARVSQPTVIRFCRSMGYSGLSEFKLNLSASIGHEGMPYVHEELNSTDSMQDVLNKVIANTAATVLGSRKSLNAADLDNAVKLMAKARRIEFYGAGNSGIVAMDAQHKLFRFGLSTVAYTDSHVQLMAAAVLSPQDVLVVISHSGSSRDLLDAIKIAKSNGAKVIGLTRAGSPVAQACDCVISVITSEDSEKYTPMISRLLQLMVIDMLTIGLALHLGENVSEMLAKTKAGVKLKFLQD
ncbi:MurR/RpiR family transcriptional regulator [Snodgrassella alvi]|jgi:RpiR family transcriptional regulator, carbohydrate utilization regulator|uniref:Transcriptional regulator n=1 Tax=Snodgrassella alvi TaxID=1196083 RepID=A0A855FR66_9NEIS|nr:MurR/RpiR family transcriptional regulator [Snodgrassella alvi]PIT11054.1 transcriptional regulator [Snodgrassella alvi]PIT47042.1 transcriptional regulator [Snodgrassella alvi]PIT58802.1 transcriptional regulator [Snodgrassella alvi]